MQSRIQASLLHLALSLSVVFLIVAVVMLLWYPAPYARAMGITKILWLLATVDIVLGPLLTLIVFKPGKPRLKADLALIVILQCAALAYGAVTVFSGRPVFVVYDLDRFTVVADADIPAVEIERAGNQAMPLSGPQVVGTRLPGNQQAQTRILKSAISGGADLAQMPMFYRPYAEVAEDVKAHMLTRDRLLGLQAPQRYMRAQNLIDAVMHASGVEASEVGFLPLRAKAQDMTVMVRRADASIIGVFPLDPWGS